MSCSQEKSGKKKRRRMSFFFFFNLSFCFQKGYLELFGVQLCSFSEVTSGLIIGFLALNSFSVSREGRLSVIQLTC